MPEFSLSRSIHVDAAPSRVHALVDDFRQWQAWSPWEDVDPALRRTYSGPGRGVGSRYEWSGNNKAGRGSMEITDSDPTKVVLDLRFLKPFKARYGNRFDVTPAGEGTDVTWTMGGERNLAMALAGRLFFDRAIGKDFEKGLGRLKAAAEGPR